MKIVVGFTCCSTVDEPLPFRVFFSDFHVHSSAPIRIGILYFLITFNGLHWRYCFANNEYISGVWRGFVWYKKYSTSVVHLMNCPLSNRITVLRIARSSNQFLSIFFFYQSKLISGRLQNESRHFDFWNNFS